MVRDWFFLCFIAGVLLGAIADSRCGSASVLYGLATSVFGYSLSVLGPKTGTRNSNQKD